VLLENRGYIDAVVVLPSPKTLHLDDVLDDIVASLQSIQLPASFFINRLHSRQSVMLSVGRIFVVDHHLSQLFAQSFLSLYQFTLLLEARFVS